MRRPLLVRRAWLICAGSSAVPPVGAGLPLRIQKRWEKTTVVAVKIKLKRLGKIREPYYRIVVADARTKRDGRAGRNPRGRRAGADEAYSAIRMRRIPGGRKRPYLAISQIETVT